MRARASHPGTWRILGLLSTATLLGVTHLAHARSAIGAIESMDQDGDGRISTSEWSKSKSKFKMIDANGDGYLTLQELKTRFGEPLDETQAAAMADPISMAAIRRAGFDDAQPQKDRGLFETGLRPVWPGDVDCPGIDEWYAKDYTNKRPKEAYHSGIDLPVPFGTPVLAAMSGEIVAVYAGESNARGFEVMIRHTPEESGLPLYVYTGYTHFESKPDVSVGQRVRMGDVLGTTGNTGLLGCETMGKDCRGRSRRPALHFDVRYSENPKYYDSGSVLVPFDGYWMDPNALYRKALPVDSQAMKALPESEKTVAISYHLDDGTLVPADTRVIWPYTCHQTGSGSTPSDRTSDRSAPGFLQ
ncbi:MAG: peptidoglycan DD-metalloendopeptidase family protein [Gammaproteobacteria bacterium]|nr:peptidoglycan DD-metalloendopeptidase family protein [Gammaproteobacteria bacterium]MCP5135192.1 peptidoglycan DD-metalloendopeptidase family protein [Gammaproteobacteria bacterium]